MNDNLHIIRFPQTILANCAREPLDSKLRREVINYREAGRPLPERLLRRLSWHPELAAQFLRAEIITSKEATRLLADPDAACSVLLESYAALGPLVEPRLLGHPPSIERLLTDQRVVRRPGLHSETDYLRLLGADAYRRYRLTPVIDRPIVLAALREESEMRWSESPGFAYFYLVTHEKIPVSPRHLEVLSQDEEYLYLTLRLLRGRQLTPADTHLVFEFRSAPWAFHVLRDRLLPERAEDLLRVLSAHPAWLAEWWQVAGWDRRQLEASYAQSAERSARHELLPELYWFYRTVISRLAVHESAA